MTIEEFELNYIEERIAGLPRSSVNGRYMEEPYYAIKDGERVYYELVPMRSALNKANMSFSLYVSAAELTCDSRSANLADLLIDFKTQKPLVLSESGRATFMLIEFLNVILKKERLQFDKFKPFLAHYVTKSYGDKTILEHAVKVADLETIELLLKAGVSLEPYLTTEPSALRYAVKKRNYKLVKLLLQYGAECSRELPVAVRVGDYEITQLLLDHGAKVNAIDFQGETVLHKLPVQQEVSEKIIRLLLERGADIDIKNKEGRTVLDKYRLNRSILKMTDGWHGQTWHWHRPSYKLLKAEKLKRDKEKQAFIAGYQKDRAFHYLGLEEDPNRIVFNPEDARQYVTDWLSGIPAAEGYVRRVCQENNIQFFDLLNALPEAEASQLFALILEGAEDPSVLLTGALHHFVGLIWSADDSSAIAKLLERANGLGLADILEENVVVNRIFETGALVYLEDPLLLCKLVQSSGIVRLGEENKQVIAETLFQSGLHCENGEEAFVTIISLLFELKDQWPQSNSTAGKEEIIFDFYTALLMQDVNTLIELAGKNPTSFIALLGGMSSQQMNLIQDKSFYVELMAQPEVKRLSTKKTEVDYNDPNEELAWSTYSLTELFAKDQEEQGKAEFSFFSKKVTKPKPLIINKVQMQSDQNSAGESMTEWNIVNNPEQNNDTIKEEEKQNTKESCLVM